MYVTEMLRFIAKSRGIEVSSSYKDLVSRKPQETRTAEEIISNISKKLQTLNGGD